MRAIWVSHTHWDREWYRSFQSFRARLVDTVDGVLDLCARDPGFRFLLDGQAIVLEDYAAIRPERVEELRSRCVEGRLGIGPWYVQPDSLLPSGEAHVRNLLEGRRAAARFGPVSTVAYTPDSFGHPAQFPQLFAGFGLRAFVYWRGNGCEWDRLPAEYDWVGPDGTALLACHLGRGYFSAASDVGSEVHDIVGKIAETAKELAARSRSDTLLLMNGIDHQAPDPRTAELVRELEAATGLTVERGLVDDFVDAVAACREERPRYSGELVGARVAPLLPGVWSTRTWIKQANRACEGALEGWAEPWAAIGAALGLPDERPALQLAWRELLVNQAHDSICGCSKDRVHEQMRSRFDAARELADETCRRSLERLAGQGALRRPPWDDELELAVFNPSPRVRTDLVRFAFDPHPYMVPSPDPGRMLHPTLLVEPARAAYTVDGAPARQLPSDPSERLAFLSDRVPGVLEFVATEVPPFGWKRMVVRRAADAASCEDRCEEVEAGSPRAAIESSAGGERVFVRVRADGSFDAELGGRRYEGLGGLEDIGDRGDSYDFDPVPASGEAEPTPSPEIRVERREHPSGIQELVVDRRLRLPEALAPERRSRSAELVDLPVRTTLRVAPGVARIDLRVELDNRARDHRLSMHFPVRESGDAAAATTFDVVPRSSAPVDDEGWVQRAPETFLHQGFVTAGGLTVAAPGLPEARFDGRALIFTLLRAVGHLSRADLETRPGPAGPGIATPGAQVPGPFSAALSLLPGSGPGPAREAELGLCAVPAGANPLIPSGRPVLALTPHRLVLSALKPLEDGDGFLVRVLNPTDQPETACLSLGDALAVRVREAVQVRLDETREGGPIEREGGTFRFEVPPHALRSVRLR